MLGLEVASALLRDNCLEVHVLRYVIALLLATDLEVTILLRLVWLGTCPLLLLVRANGLEVVVPFGN